MADPRYLRLSMPRVSRIFQGAVEFQIQTGNMQEQDS